MTLSSFCGPHLNEGAERGRLLLNHLFICLLEIANSPLKSACCCTAKHQSELKFSLRTLQVHLYNQAQKGTKVHSIHLPDYCSLLTRTQAEIPFICSFPSQFDDNSFLKLLAQDKNSKVKSTSKVHVYGKEDRIYGICEPFTFSAHCDLHFFPSSQTRRIVKFWDSQEHCYKNCALPLEQFS